MVSISAQSFYFFRQRGPSGLVELRTVKKPQRIYWVNTFSGEGYRTVEKATFRATKRYNIILPKKMAKTLIHACIIHDRASVGHRQIWRPRWPA